jgi:hypothetical protein
MSSYTVRSGRRLKILIELWLERDYGHRGAYEIRLNAIPKPIAPVTGLFARKTEAPHLVQRALGHRQMTTTEICAKVSDGALRQAVSLY